MYKFDAKDATNKCVEWVRNWFEKNGKGCNAVIGISGGKDSSIAAAICVAALGKERVFGVLMPQGEQFDIDYAFDICKFLEIDHVVINIKDAVDGVLNNIPESVKITDQTKFNLPPRIRMATLYAVSQSKNGRVVNTCNLSEDWVGYSTRYGDSVGDFSPLSNLTVTEVIQMGYVLGVPSKFLEKTPIDGLCGKTDEDNLGFTYKMLDQYIREGIEPPKEIKERIDDLHRKNLFKLQLMESFKYQMEEGE